MQWRADVGGVAPRAFVPIQSKNNLTLPHHSHFPSINGLKTPFICVILVNLNPQEKSLITLSQTKANSTHQFELCLINEDVEKYLVTLNSLKNKGQKPARGIQLLKVSRAQLECKVESDIVEQCSGSSCFNPSSAQVKRDHFPGVRC